METMDNRYEIEGMEANEPIMIEEIQDDRIVLPPNIRNYVREKVSGQTFIACMNSETFERFASINTRRSKVTTPEDIVAYNYTTDDGYRHILSKEAIHSGKFAKSQLHLFPLYDYDVLVCFREDIMLADDMAVLAKSNGNQTTYDAHNVFWSDENRRCNDLMTILESPYNKYQTTADRLMAINTLNKYLGYIAIHIEEYSPIKKEQLVKNIAQESNSNEISVISIKHTKDKTPAQIIIDKDQLKKLLKYVKYRDNETSFFNEIELCVNRNKYEIAIVAMILFRSKIIANKPRQFKRWLKEFSNACNIKDVPTYTESQLSTRYRSKVDEIKGLFYYL